MPSLCLIYLLLIINWKHPVTASRFLSNVAGPYRIVPDHMERCPDSVSLGGNMMKDLSWKGFRDRNNVDVWYYWINITTLFTLDDSYDFDMNWASWSSRGGWKENAYVMKPGRFCKIVPRHSPDFWHKLLIVTFNDPNRQCPFYPGFYEIRNMSTDFTIKMVPVFFYGTWRVTIRLFEESKPIESLCVRLFGKTVPKQ